MIDLVGLTHKPLQSIHVEDRVVDEVETFVPEMVRDVAGLAHRQVVQDGDFMALLHQGVHQVGADEARAAGDQDSHSASSS